MYARTKHQDKLIQTNNTIANVGIHFCLQRNSEGDFAVITCLIPKSLAYNRSLLFSTILIKMHNVFGVKNLKGVLLNVSKT